MNAELTVLAAEPIELPKFSLSKEGEDMIEKALVAASPVGRVSNEVEVKVGTDVMIQLKSLINLLEKTRVAHVAPALNHQRETNAFFKEKSAELNKEMLRISKLVGDYQSLQLAKARAEENARNEELTRLEREREASLAKTNTHEEREAVQAHYNDRAKIEAPPVQTAEKPKGLSVKTELVVTVTDIWLLARAHPSCVTIDPKLQEIKSLHRAGVKVAGVTVTDEIKAGVRAAPIKTVDV